MRRHSQAVHPLQVPQPAPQGHQQVPPRAALLAHPTNLHLRRQQQQRLRQASFSSAAGALDPQAAQQLSQQQQHQHHQHQQNQRQRGNNVTRLTVQTRSPPGDRRSLSSPSGSPAHGPASAVRSPLMHHVFDVKKEPSPDYPLAGNQSYSNPSGLGTDVLNMSPSLGSAVGDDLVSAVHAASYGMSPADHELFSPISLPSGEYLFDPSSTPQDMAGTPPDAPGSPLAFAASGPIDVKMPRSAAATSGVNIMRNGYGSHFGPLRHPDGATPVAAMGSPVPSVSTAHFHSMSLPVRSVDWFVAQAASSSLGVGESFVGGSPQTRGPFTRELAGSPGLLESHESDHSGTTFAVATGLSHTELTASSVAQVYGGSFPTSNANVELIYEKRRRRRESHNAVERRRRDNINEKIHELSTLLPDCLISPTNKPNKGIILRKSVDYIRQLQQLVQQQGYRNAELESMLHAQGVDVGSLYSSSGGCATPVMEGVHGEASVSANASARSVLSSASAPASQMPASGLTAALHHHHRQQMQLQLQHHRPFQARDAGVSFGYSDEFGGGLPLSPTTSDGSQ